jgi:hypothetical protein
MAGGKEVAKPVGKPSLAPTVKECTPICFKPENI